MDLNPQAKQMADESMVRGLHAQAAAIWPQEVALFGRYRIPADAAILDAGCGTGEGSSRLATLYPQARVLGVDIIDAHLALARERYQSFGPRLRFERQSVFGLELPSASFDLVVCRHVIHSIPQPDTVLTELVRVARSGGFLHVIAEDYGMLHFQKGAIDLREFWCMAPASFAAATNTDLFVGRNTFAMFAALGLKDIAIDYVVVDPLRVPRDVMASIFEAWRDGYVESIGQLTSYSSQSARAAFDQMIATVKDPNGYAVWFVPVISGQVT
ncbi:MAG TPA: class I SAM-dependent methyltransferase [Candidatus Acidoferrales bacterium]|nr:class I SAM-dependent methyltransferase [Candidatus Acidoferrales bacterium]